MEEEEEYDIRNYKSIYDNKREKLIDEILDKLDREN